MKWQGLSGLRKSCSERVKSEDWPCFLEIMRLELTALTFVTTRPNKQALMALTAPKVDCVDFCHDSAITKQALMALAAPKVEKF